MKRRIIALLTAAMLLMAICPAALAEGENVTISVGEVVVNPGETVVSIQVTVVNKN